MEISREGSVRVDLAGGTLDISPMHLILKDVVTLNVATSLKAKVNIKDIDFDGVIIESRDYSSRIEHKSVDFTKENLFYNEFFGPLKFVAQILDYFKLHSGVEITLESGSPAGAGLGGSSAMGVTLFKALCAYREIEMTPKEMIGVVQNIEGRILNKGMPGYQDYFPALFGGVLALHPGADGVQVEQLYSKELCEALEKRVTLVFSGKSRLSGINNWEVYKSFFDGDEGVRKGLSEIAALSNKLLSSIKDKKYDELVSFIAKEGEEREKLFPNILTIEMKKLVSKLKESDSKIGLKVCGAGGGGCFILLHPVESKQLVQETVLNEGMEILPFEILGPLGD